MAVKQPFARPFPLAWFHPRCRVPLAVRLGAVAEWRLSRIQLGKLAPKPRSNLQYVTMASRAHWLLLRESLVSMHRSWASLPELVVISDGSWTKTEFDEAFDFWPESIRVLSPKEVLDPLAIQGQTQLVELARRHPLGLKLAGIILLGQERPTLFVDSDVLWFSDPSASLSSLQGTVGPAAAVESGATFNETLARKFCPQILNPPGINTGCVWLHGNLCEPGLLRHILDAALEQPDHEFNEQTIIAIAVELSGRRMPREICLVEFNDAFALGLRKPGREGFHARHYVRFMRHQFYRDALDLRKDFGRN
jgi:hypothetical protein